MQILPLNHFFEFIITIFENDVLDSSVMIWIISIMEEALELGSTILFIKPTEIIALVVWYAGLMLIIKDHERRKKSKDDKDEEDKEKKDKDKNDKDKKNILKVLLLILNSTKKKDKKNKSKESKLNKFQS